MSVPDLRDMVKRTNEIADAVVEVSSWAKKIKTGKLNMKAIETLLHHETKISRRDIKRVFDELEQLEAKYVNKKYKEETDETN